MTAETEQVSPTRSDVVGPMFGTTKPIIGTIHVLALPGAPGHDGKPMRDIIARAVSDAEAYARGGVDGLVIENEGDIPFRKPADVGHETVACMTAVACAVAEAVDLPFGVNCLANAVEQSLAVAKATGGVFVRANQWANAYVANEGFVEGAAAAALRFRKAIDAQDVAVLADVHVKHGSHAIVADRSLAEMTRDVEAFGADIMIATGNRTGDGTPLEEVEGISAATTRPVFIGSGLTAERVASLLAVADGAIVGSAMKQHGVWWEPVDTAAVERIMHEVEQVR